MTEITDAVFRSGEDLLRAKSLAIVGASDNSAWAKEIYGSLQFAGYRGRVELINPRYPELWGQRCYPSFAALPEPVQHAVVLVKAEMVVPTLTEGAENGLRSALVFASSIGDGEEPESPVRAEALRALVARTGLRVCGPNCLGTVSVREGLILFPHPTMKTLPAGPVGAIFQSGGILQFWMRILAERGIGLSYGVSSGTEIDFDLADGINFLLDDPGTRIITLFIEGVRRPGPFMQACERALKAGKPVIAMKIGRSARAATQAKLHTGALTGDDAVFDAFCDRYGVIRCQTLQDLLETVIAFTSFRLPKGDRMGVVVHSGGVKGMILDDAETHGGRFGDLGIATQQSLRTYLTADVRIENPLDASAGGFADPSKFAGLCAEVVKDPEIDILAINGVLPTDEAKPKAAAAYRALVEATDKPVLGFARMQYSVDKVSRAHQQDAGMPFLQGVPETVRAMMAMIRYAKARGKVVAHPRAPGHLPPGSDVQEMLAKAGLPPPRSALAAGPDQAAAAAARIGFPVALKLVSAEISHKTEFGAVRLDLRSAEEVAAACADLARSVAERRPGTKVDGFLVQEMVKGIEIVVGAREDPVFGPILLIGSGGTQVELLRDSAICLLPVDEAAIRSVLSGLRVNTLLQGFRGAPPADIDALVRAVQGLAEFYLANRASVPEIEINPLMVREAGKGLAAVDVRYLTSD